jgi:diacylglycerol kinase (ATP)
MGKTTYVIWNPSAGSATQKDELRDLLQRHLPVPVVVRETNSANEATDIVEQVAGEAGMLVAAGGDGTVHTVINGLMRCTRRPPLGLLPMGTGNTFCGTLGIPLDPVAAMHVIASGVVQTVDLAHVGAVDGQCYFANVASGGNSDRVVEMINADDKQTWGPWCYLRSALPIMAELDCYDTEVTFDDNDVQQLRLWNVIVANGRHAAGRLPVAPRAMLDDGLLDVVLIKDGTPLDLAALAAEFFLSDYLEDERVIFRRTASLSIESTPELRFLADGEMVIGQPFHFRCEPRALQVVAGEPPPAQAP